MRTVGKQLHFPALGIGRGNSFHDQSRPDQKREYSTPYAVNVRGACTFGDRRRGGSRPGLKRLSGVSSASTGVWRWPGGGELRWPDGSAVLYDIPSTSYAGPDGAPFVDPHRTYTPVATKGTAPSGVQAMALYRYRLFVAKGSQWYASRSCETTDWDYGGDMEDVARAATGNVALAGVAGERITAMMPVSDRHLYVATERSLWCLTGEPTNGSFSRVLDGAGCVGPNAWCFDGARVWFLSNCGVFAVVPGEAPALFSDEVPKLKGTDANALMVADHDGSGIHVFSSVDGDWFLDSEAKAVWPVSIPVTMRPTAAAHVMVSHANVTALLGTDGKWRYFADDQATDDGTAISSAVAIGPFRCGENDATDGMLDELDVTTGEGSSVVTARVYVSHSAEGAEKARANGHEFCSFDFSGGWNRVVRPRARGAWAMVVFSSSGRWAFEGAFARMKALGRLR